MSGSSQQPAAVSAETLKRLRAECRGRRRQLHQLVVKAKDHGLVSDSDVRKYQILLKRLNPLRESRDPDDVQEAIDQYEEWLDEYRSRLQRADVDVNQSAAETGEEAASQATDKPKNSDTPSPDAAVEDDGVPPEEHPTGTVTATNGSASPAAQQSGRSRVRLDELTEERLDEIGRRHQLVLSMERGASAREAVEASDFDRSRRWASKLYNRYKKEGVAGLIDRRWGRKSKPTVLTQAVRSIILGHRYKKPQAPVEDIYARVQDECAASGEDAPAYESVRRYLETLPEAAKLFLTGGPEAWDEEARPTVRREQRARHGNQLWEVDETSLPVWIRARDDDGNWVPARPHLLAGIDVYSRTIPAITLTPDAATADTVLLWLRRAIEENDRDGWSTRWLPQKVLTDHGRIFKAKTVKAAFAQLGIEHELAPPNWAQGKPYIERFFQTLDTGFLRRSVPSHKKAIGKSEGAAMKRLEELPTVSMLEEVLRDWIAESYHQGQHTEAERSRRRRWEETVRRRQPEEEQLQALLHRTEQTRVVQRTGVRATLAGERHRYWAPQLVEHFKDEVWLAYTPDALESVLVYSADTGDYICEAYDLRHPDAEYSVEDVKEERRQYRRAQKKRFEELQEKVEEAELERLARREWEHAHAGADRLEEEAGEEPADGEGDSLADRLEQADRAEDPDEVIHDQDSSEESTSLAELREQHDRGELSS